MKAPSLVISAACQVGIAPKTALTLLKEAQLLPETCTRPSLGDIPPPEKKKFLKRLSSDEWDVTICQIAGHNIQLNQLLGTLRKCYEAARARKHLGDRLRYKTAKQQHGPSLYYKYLYVQQMATTQHGLQQQEADKSVFKGPLSDLELVSEHISFDITTKSLFYAFKDFHMLPHGSALNSERMIITEAMEKANIKHTHIQAKWCSHGKYLLHDNIKIYYPESKEFSTLDATLSTIDWGHFLVYVLNHGSITRSRDDPGEDAVAKRASFGFGQVQGANSPKSITYNGHYLPLLQYTFLEEPTYMPINLQLQLATLLEECQALLDASFSTPIMQNKKRTYLMAVPFNMSLGHLYSRSRFEYVDVFVEINSVLNRHMDYKNDHRQGYSYGASYSRVIGHENKLYRVNFVMTTRRDCGSKMDKIQTQGLINPPPSKEKCTLQNNST